MYPFWGPERKPNETSYSSQGLKSPDNVCVCVIEGEGRQGLCFPVNYFMITFSHELKKDFYNMQE